jgi:signal transduction histidine kinase/CHASE3 domain sensor protein
MQIMNLKTIFKSAFFLKAIFVISIFMLLYISSVSYKHTKALNESSDLLVHSYKVQYQLEHVLSMLKDAETGQRGFIITRNPVFLKPYRSVEDQIYASFIKLKALTIVDQQQQANLDSLLKLIYARLDLMELSLEGIRKHTINESLLNQNLLAGKSVMDNIRIQINKMEDLEISYFNEHQKKYETEVIFSPISTFIFAIFSLLVFILSFIKINTDLSVLKKSNTQLMITNESIKHAEIIGEFYTSQWNLATGELTYSDNLYRLLGCEPQSFMPSVENFLKYVHPDDKTIVQEAADKTIHQGETLPYFYRVIREDGELRYFMSMGKFISDEKSKMHIGIGKDITDHHLSSIALEERNHELEQSIKELESFNRVASHDLQEPLRKIQTFISRITDHEKVNLSEQGKEYISRIDSSAHKMRILIDDLLLFSRTNKSEKIFEKTDLNKLLENATQELAHDIEEKNAVIQSAQLPVLNGIAFQIQQLFLNLIGNALKYSKPDVPPLIKIECEKLAARDYPGFITDTRKKYFKISISDNGIGFDPQYAEKIFILFHRLHHSTEYVGTGIGLSICKKIAENHNGFIVAEGKPGEGATFTVYLPV